MDSGDWLREVFKAASGFGKWDRSVPLLLAKGRILIVDRGTVDEVTVRRLPADERPFEVDLLSAPEAE
jgi:hypothetical protein